MAGCGGGGATEPESASPEKPAFRTWVVPNSKVCHGGGAGLGLPKAPAMLVPLRLEGGFTGDPANVLVRLVDMTTEVALTRPWKRLEEAAGKF